jgi:hypothetical protein
MLFVKSLSRSFTALAVQGSSFSRPVRPSIASTFLFFKPQNLQRPSLTTLSLSSSSFHPPEPPAFKGQPVFNNIPLSEDERSDDAKRRTEDEGAVFVVTGASRGIGLEMVKQLLDRTKVRRKKWRNMCSCSVAYVFKFLILGFNCSML